MEILDIIDKKRANKQLSKEEIEYVVSNYVSGKIEDYKMSALLMAICINEMTLDETVDLTIAMMNSGDIIDFKDMFDTLVIDKHSTGGIGDKITLIVLPIVASLGIKTFKMAGKGLGFTGGTIDKVESIKGFNATLPIERAKRLLNDINLALITQTDKIAVADKKIYELRGVSGTVKSIPLIASSVMSKKLASGVDKIVLEVTFGSGAFIKDEHSARRLAKLMVDIGKKMNKEVVALLTSMDEPIGRNVGNSLEILEVIDFLNRDYSGLESKDIEDLKIVSFEVAAQMMKLAGMGDNTRKNKQKIAETIVNKKAYSKFIELIKGQGGYIKSEYLEVLGKSIDVPILKSKAKCRKELYLSVDGYVTNMNAENIGNALVYLGGGRLKKDDVIDHSVGFVFNKKIGDKVKMGESLITIYYNETSNIEKCIEYLTESIEIDNISPEKKQHIIEIIS